MKDQHFNPMLDASIFGDVEPNKIRFAKPKTPKFQKKETKKAEPKTSSANPNSDRATVNFGEDHELNYHLKKNGLSQSIANRKALTELGVETKEKLGKKILTHEEVDDAIIANIDRFKALKSK